MRNQQSFEFDISASLFSAGVDEAGRGPLAGPVIASAVILDPARPIDGLADSKKLTESQRERLAPLIKERALAWAIGRADVQEIDELNILHATMLAMRRAIDALNKIPDLVYVDGNRCPDVTCRCVAVVKGDSKIPSVSAASILAKVTRDHEMLILDRAFPNYGFAKHKGYGTAQHVSALHEFGVTSAHRRSFEPVKTLCLSTTE